MTARSLRRTFFVALAFLITGCANLAPLLASRTPTTVPVQQATSTHQVFPTQTAPPQTTARILRVWLPPRFDPNAETESASLLKQRLADFEAEHPGLEIEIRIKAEDGDANLISALSITGIAAPAALPDLIALARPAFEAAASKGLLHPMDGLSNALHDPNWYAYARELGHIQNIGYGLPFAGDALALAYRSEIEGGIAWVNMPESGNMLIFPADDPQGLFGLALYVSAGGTFLDANGLPHLDQDALVKVLSWLRDGASAEWISPSVKDFATYDDTLDLYRSGAANMTVTWTSDLPPGSIAPIPGLGDSAYSFATGWVWALAGSNPENQQIAIELAEYLVADDFIGEWTRQAGYLPTRPTSVVDQDVAIAAVIESAHAILSNEVLQVLGPLMQEALIRVLNGEQPEAAAGSVLEKLK